MAMEYKILATRDYDDLVTQVNADIKQGWKPFGSLQLENFSDTAVRYMQPMIKDETASKVEVNITRAVELAVRQVAAVVVPQSGGTENAAPKTRKVRKTTKAAKTKKKAAKKSKE